jgi:magnesium transporter
MRELTFETAAEHCTRCVPFAAPQDRAGAVRAALPGHAYDTAAEVVVCDLQGRLLGLVNIEDLLVADEDVRISQLMDASPPTIAPHVDQEIAVWKAIHHGESSLAVVDDDEHFLGMISARRILEVLLWEHHEDTARLGGILRGRSEASMASGEPLRRRLWHRLPWLLMGLLGAVLSADIVGAFESQLQARVVLAFFIPGIVYLADAVGTQTETLVIRGLSVGINVERIFWRECGTGTVIGLLLAALMFPIILLRWGAADVAIAVAVALFSACSVASLLAMSLPWGLRRLNYDPAFAAGPLATVIQDLLSVLIYFAACRAIVS